MFFNVFMPYRGKYLKIQAIKIPFHRSRIRKKEYMKTAAKNLKVINKLKPEQHGLQVLPGLIVDSCEKIIPAGDTAYYCPVRLIGA